MSTFTGSLMAKTALMVAIFQSISLIAESDPLISCADLSVLSGITQSIEYEAERMGSYFQEYMENDEARFNDESKDQFVAQIMAENEELRIQAELSKEKTKDLRNICSKGVREGRTKSEAKIVVNDLEDLLSDLKDINKVAEPNMRQSRGVREAVTGALDKFLKKLDHAKKLVRKAKKVFKKLQEFLDGLF